MAQTHGSETAMNNTGSTAEKQSRVIAQEASAQQKGEKLRRYALLPWLSRDWVLGVAFFLIAMGFNLYRLGVPSIWFDEAFSVELARQPFPLLWQIIFGPEPNMELYYLFLHGWLGLTSLLGLHDTEFVVRLPSTIFPAS